VSRIKRNTTGGKAVGGGALAPNSKRTNATFQVDAYSRGGLESAPQNAPTSLSATVTQTTAVISFTAPSNDGGSAITNYEYSFNNSTWTALSPADAISPVTVSGLTAGTSYTIYLRAVNIVGFGTASTGLAVTTSPPPFLATGGTEFTMGGYRYLRFTGSQNMSVTYSGSAEVLVVAGGGGGGVGRGGGGGGGGVRRAGNTTYQTLNFVAGNAYVTVGGGGGSEGSGGASSIVHAAGTLAASGGGRGGGGAGSSGGSGGGGSQGSGPGSGNSGGYSPAEGFSGGSGGGWGNSGGGAASAAGSGAGHAGGVGFNVNTLDPNLTTVLGYTIVGSGGGGGGDCNTGGSQTGAGSGAGAGGYGNDAGSGSSWGSGGGGSASCFGAIYPGGSGRQGVVVVRFPV